MPSEVGKNVRMRFIAQKTSGGITKRKVSLYCQILGVSRQGFYRYMKVSKLPWKYRIYAEYMMQILAEDKCNDCYGRVRMREALRQCLPAEVPILSENTVQKIMCEIGSSATILNGLLRIMALRLARQQLPSWATSSCSTIPIRWRFSVRDTCLMPT